MKPNVECMPSKEVLKQVRQAYDEITVLCEGDAGRGIVGWMECFNTAKNLLER